MISKNMYKVLKKIPRSPQKTSYTKLLKRKKFNADLLIDILRNAEGNRYIYYADFGKYSNITNSNFYITEKGIISIEEYEREKNSSAKSTWAIIISALSFISSIVAIILSICGVQ